MLLMLCHIAPSKNGNGNCICCYWVVDNSHLLCQIVGISKGCDQNSDSVCLIMIKVAIFAFWEKGVLVKFKKYGTLSIHAAILGNKPTLFFFQILCQTPKTSPILDGWENCHQGVSLFSESIFLMDFLMMPSFLARPIRSLQLKFKRRVLKLTAAFMGVILPMKALCMWQWLVDVPHLKHLR